MKSALVTGANKGIGFEVAKILAQKGFLVYLGCRKLENGLSAVEKLKSLGLTNVEAIELDVTDQDSVHAASTTIGEKSEILDVLVNNAGIAGEIPQSAIHSTIDQFKTVYETNVFGVVRVTQTFIELLKKSAEPRIVNVSSAMGSLALAANKSSAAYDNKIAIYQSSKTALNMYTVQLAYELRDTAFKVNAVCPGWTKTDFTNQQGTSTVEEAGQRIAKYALIGHNGPTGEYFSEEYFPGSNCPW
ncbi:NAD(P)-dependent dehydrogenase (short-subunit alcohol dehydrogenase family) [Pedobacter cryoconitis]|uniref:NAD(P)-dependent dehydrogenase (Short-subunit alcohol dehydrogenase family) n=1 Tax=Pedobacter cryoconitis TaxID=188932 RepID=A0A7W9DZJ4_9SPHI|nr:SDR family oxidoreductase [Pedobacter cryoconitis]MBB5637088.1 NAD(P)-dependent dehydrogenase (short-subunit alcohol dehydrogenase family) [Pedobacter cryoconitis]